MADAMSKRLFQEIAKYQVEKRDYTGTDLNAQSDLVRGAETIQQQLLGQHAQYKTMGKSAAGDEKFNTAQLGAALAKQGVIDLSILLVIGGGKLLDTLTGKVINENSLNTAQGDGFTNFKVLGQQDGKPVFGAQWEDSSDRGKIAQALSLAMMFIPGAQGFATALGSGLGASGTLATVLGRTLINTGIGAIGGASGSDLLRGAAGSVLGAGAGQLAGAAGLGDLASRAVSGGVTGAIRGGDLQSALTGAVGAGAGGVNPALGTLLRVILSQRRTPGRG